MNGIAGIINARGSLSLAHAPQRMFERMCHDSGRGEHYDCFEQPGLRIGGTTTRGDATIAVPAWSESGRIGVLFAGDEFSLHGHRARRPAAALQAAGLANRYEQSGLAALAELNGWFSGVIVDLRDDTTTLFNDRYGLGRIYYHASAQGFFFSTEAKSLLAVSPSLRQIDPRSLAEFFSLGCVLQNRTLFHDVALLPPGSAWIFDRHGGIDKHRYFDPGVWEGQTSLSVADYGENLRSVFARLGRCHGGSEGGVAMSLTGGLDSRAIMAWSTAEPGTLPCYTFGGPYRDCADVVIARRLAALCQHPHTTIRIGADFFPRFSDLAAEAVYLSDGAMDVSGAVELHVNRQAREIAPVRLTGNYGSEILRSHVAFRPTRLDRSLFTPEFSALIDQAEDTYRTEAACHRQTFIAFKQVPWHHYARFAVEKSQLLPRSPFLDNELVALSYRAPPELAGSAAPLLDLIAHGNPRLADIGTDRALRSRNTPIVSQLSRSWQEFTAKAEYAYDYGMPPWLTRADRMLTRLRLEKLFLGRHKFYHFRVWYRDQLSDAVGAHTLGGDAAPEPFCYRAGAPARLAREHLSGRGNRTLALHKLLTVQFVERLLIRQS